MDVKLIALMITACISGSYKNENSLPSPSKGNYAEADERYRYSRSTDFPNHSRRHRNIYDGNEYLMFDIVSCIIIDYMKKLFRT